VTPTSIECPHQPFENELQREVRITKEEVVMERFIAQAMQAISQGKELLDVAMLYDESPNMDLVFTAMDYFKQASLLARDYDMEQEAIACAYIGKVFEKVIKLKFRAKEYYMQVMNLTEACKPRTFHNKDWYTFTTQSLQLLQHEAWLRTDLAKQQERQVYLDELKEELEILTKADYDMEKDKRISTDVLVSTILEKFPPKKKTCFLEENMKSLRTSLAKKDEVEFGSEEYENVKKQIKKLLIKFLSDYHPDKNRDHGKKWEILCEEITKVVTRRYEGYK